MFPKCSRMSYTFSGLSKICPFTHIYTRYILLPTSQYLFLPFVARPVSRHACPRVFYPAFHFPQRKISRPPGCSPLRGLTYPPLCSRSFPRSLHIYIVRPAANSGNSRDIRPRHCTRLASAVRRKQRISVDSLDILPKICYNAIHRDNIKTRAFPLFSICPLYHTNVRLSIYKSHICMITQKWGLF